MARYAGMLVCGMCVCRYVGRCVYAVSAVHIYICVCMCIYIYMYTVYIHKYIHIYMYTCLFVHACMRD